MTPYELAVASLKDNAEQRQALESVSHCVVLAGPGSGKTKTLTLKMASLLLEDVRPPRGIACVTYSTECVRELERRLDRLQTPGLDRAFVGTLHGFCLRHILIPFGPLLGIPVAPRVATTSQRQAAMDCALKVVRLSGSSVQLELDRLRRTQIDRVPPSWDSTAGLERLCVAYEAALEAAGLIDFDGIVLRALHMVETHEWVRKVLRGKFPVLLVDEYQDLGLALHRLVLKLCLEGGVRLFAVGDPDQSIYGFTGARPALLETLSKRNDIQTVRLRLNYRSATRIIAASNTALGQVRGYQATTDAEGLIDFHECRDGLAGEVDGLLDLLADLRVRIRSDEIAILHPTKVEGALVERALRNAGYDFIRIGNGAAYPKSPLVRVIEEAARWCAGGWRDGSPRLSRIVRKWLGVQGTMPQEDARNQVRRLVRFLFGSRDPDAPASSWLANLEKAVVGPVARSRIEGEGELECLEQLRDVLAPTGSLSHFSVRHLGGQMGVPDHLSLLTLHSSKGREFDAVIIFGADVGRIPSQYVKTPEALAEARRLFFVGISRARHEVHLLFAQESPFVNEIRQQLAAS